MLHHENKTNESPGKLDNNEIVTVTAESTTAESGASTGGEESSSAAFEMEPWGTTSSSRIGQSFQVSDLPLPGESMSNSEEYSTCIWSAHEAEERGSHDFVHLHCPLNKREFAIPLLHERGYRVEGVLDALETISPLDGSDWTNYEKETFSKLFRETKRNISTVAKRLNKSVNNCLTFLYSTAGSNVRMTRSATRSMVYQTSYPETATSQVSIFPTSSTADMIGLVNSNDEQQGNEPRIMTRSSARRTLRPRASSPFQHNGTKDIEKGQVSDDDSSESPTTTSAASPSSSPAVATRRSKRRKSENTKTTTTTTTSSSSPETNVGGRTVSRSSMWDTRFQDLIKFKEENGHCLVPKVYPENQPLSSWVFRQRTEYKKKRMKKIKSNYLTDERFKRMEKIGFVWRAKSTAFQKAVNKQKRMGCQQERWDHFFHELVVYKEETGHCLVPKRYKENQPLAAWVFKQRQQYKVYNEGKESSMTKERVQKLVDLGFVWAAKQNKEWIELDKMKKRKHADDLWDEHFDKLVKFKEETGHTRVPKTYQKDQILATWAFRQRAHHRSLVKGFRSNLTESRKEKLVNLGFEFFPHYSATDKSIAKSTTSASSQRKTT